MGSGGWLHKGKVLAPLIFVVLYENLLILFNVLCHGLLAFKKWNEWWIKKEKKPIIYVFYWFERTRSFAYVPCKTPFSQHVDNI